MKSLKYLALAAIVALSGCCAQLPVLRESMDQATRTTRAEHLDWAQRLHDGKPMPKISDADLKVRQQAEASYQALVNDSRKAAK